MLTHHKLPQHNGKQNDLEVILQQSQAVGTLDLNIRRRDNTDLVRRDILFDKHRGQQLAKCQAQLPMAGPAQSSRNVSSSISCKWRTGPRLQETCNPRGTGGLASCNCGRWTQGLVGQWVPACLEST